MKTIEFEHPYPYPECCSEEDATSIYIHIANPSDDIDSLPNGDEIVTPAAIKILFSYPLSNPTVFEFNNGPYTRAQLAQLICDTYAEIYDAEDDTTAQPAGMISPNSLNRNTTNGKYGIWGHGIGDLALHTVYTGDIYKLGIDS